MNEPILKVAIRNFEVLGTANLVFYPGITIIGGPNSSGKSSVFRAISAAILNSSLAKTQIKHGAEECSVGLKAEDSKSVVFTRSEKSAQYVINRNEEFSTLNRSSLPDIYKEFPFVIDQKQLMCMMREGEALFPYGNTSTAMYKLFERFMSVSNSERVFKQIREDTRRVRDEQSTTQYKLNLVDQKMTAVRQFLNEYTEETLQKYIQVAQKCEGMFQEIQEDRIILRSCEALSNIPVWEYQTFPDDTNYRFLQQDIAFVETCLGIPKFDVRNFEFVFSGIFEDVQQAALFQELSTFEFTIRDFSDISLEAYQDCTHAISIFSEVETITRTIQQHTETLSALEKEFSAFDTCPLCGSNL